MTEQRDDGLTLVELLIATTIAIMVFTVVAAAFILSLRSTSESTDRLLESHDGAFTSAWFYKDVQSAQTVSTSGVCTGVLGAVVAGLTWQETLSTGTTQYKVDYRFDGATGRLTRHACGPTARKDVLATRLGQLPALSCDTRTCSLSMVAKLQGNFTLTASRRLP